MARNRVALGIRLVLAVAAWGAAIGVVQVTLGADLGRAVHEFERRIELRVRGAPPAPEPQPERSHEEDPIEPWELVSV
jgi:hypothetical protein